MTPRTTKFQRGVEATEFPQTPLALGRKTLPKHNVLVGDDPAQARFMEQLTGVVARVVTTVNDDDLLGKDEPQLLQVDSARLIALSPTIRKKTGIWSLAPLVPGSAGLTALVKEACLIAKVDKPNAEGITQIGVQLLRDVGDLEGGERVIRDLNAALWACVWLLSGPLPEPPKRWTDPWRSNTAWLPRGVEPAWRLNALYKDLIGYVFALENDQTAARKFGISPKRFQWLKTLSLDLRKVDKTLCLLSTWHANREDPLVVALKISTTWQN